MAIRLRRAPVPCSAGRLMAAAGPGGTSRASRLVRLAVLGSTVLGSAVLGSANALGATPTSPNQPVSIPTDQLPPPPCPLVVPRELPALQPLRLHPSQVEAKNRRGCLSPADAIYGPDGCPRRLCGAGGAFSLPPEP